MNKEHQRRYGICWQSIENFADTNLLFGDYIRIKKLNYGDVFVLEDMATKKNTEIVVIGNGTPYEGISSVSNNGWDYELYNSWRVLEVFRIELSRNGTFLYPVRVQKAYDNLTRRIRNDRQTNSPRPSFND